MYHSDYSIESGVSRFMYKVYGWMSAGLAITAGIAYYLSTSELFIQALVTKPFLLMVLFLIQIGLVIGLSMFVMRMNYATAVGCFLLYAACVGISLTPIFLVYTLGSIYLTFAITASMFGFMCIYGYLTDADLTSIGNICTMMLFGLIIAMVVNMFLKSATMDYVLSAIGVVVFSLLTAYDSQKIKQMGSQLMTDPHTRAKVAILGALTLYLDFINLFLFLLRFTGNRSRD
ncbi:MAG: Bax inhibitor-1/YccA family protein [Candidatus Babeliales bacterium]|nr:Bax inhibitor-1/YccA family protein [Candidatus Babeliales bacterium]